ncbi:MAG: Rab family GTPase [Candidatus Thorarchaeota archaeon]
MVDTTAHTSSFDYLFKTIVVGDGAVGKTAITFRYAEDKFQENYKMTIGVDFTIKRLILNNKTIKCQIWDTGGQERFSKIRPLYYRGALGCLVVYDVTNMESFEHLEHWFGEVKTNCTKIPIILVGNKIDLKNRKVTADAGKEYAKEKSKELGYKIPYLETSAKTGETIKKVFNDLVKMMVSDAEKAIEEREKKNK